MKRLALLFIVLIPMLYACKQKALDNSLIFSGKIKHPNSDTLNIVNNNQDIIKSIILKEDHTFRDTLTLPEGFYNIDDGKEISKIYLKPQFDLHITLDTKAFDESINFKGKGANENNYLAKKTLLEEGFGQLNYYTYYAKLAEQDFLKLIDSLNHLSLDLLNTTKHLNKDFIYMESRILEFQKLYKYYSYENMHKFVTGNKDFKVSKNYPNPFEHVNLSDEKLLTSSDYIFYIQAYLNQKAENNTSKNTDPILNYVKTIKSEIKNELILDELMYSVGKWELNYTKKLDSVFYYLKSNLTNTNYLKEVTKNYNTFKKIEKGAISPSFELNDINGTLISLNDLKGKLVYIDIWATWCLPCIKEIPSLKKMEAHFKGNDIAFVSICKSDTEERWRAMVKDKALGGIQLFAPENKISFFETYAVQGIPRFILIDKTGKIIDPNAKRPSNLELLEEIESYL
jgi:thiol-disulfide isomerase/thioredoxin